MTKQTHEAFIAAVQRAAIARLSADDAAKLQGIKLVYGAGQTGLRGVTYYGQWANGGSEAAPFVEVCAFGQENWTQLAGTTIHELAHVLAGPGAGHGPLWKAACERLGLRRARAAGHVYLMAGFAPDVREVIAATPKPDDGQPVASLQARFGQAFKVKPCGAGIGARGGKSRGAGSGSRLRLFECACEPPVKARVAADTFAATCDCCHSGFQLKQKSEAPATAGGGDAMALLAMLTGN